MKIVKLTRKYKAFNYGFTHALRYDCSHTDDSFYMVEKRLADMHGQPSYDERRARYHPYMTSWGRRDPKTRMYLKWIYLKQEADITMLILSGTLRAD